MDTEARAARVEDYAKDLTSGRVFILAANGHGSRYGYQPPIRHDSWARIIETIANYAKMGDQAAATARAIVGKVNLYGTEAQAMQSIANALYDVAKGGYFDVIGATGPEAGRRSAYQKEHTLREGIMMYLLLIECEAAIRSGYPNGEGDRASIGWCLWDLMKRENVFPYACYLPRVAKAVTRTREHEAAKAQA
jgi:hypothetical protein